MQRHLYKEPADDNECTPDDWKQTDIIRANLQAEYAKKCFAPPRMSSKDLAFTYLVMWLIFITGILAGKYIYIMTNKYPRIKELFGEVSK